ncbi:Tkl protein kinase, partial [Globisporangium splendens]
MRTLCSVVVLALVAAPLARANTDISAQLQVYKDSVTAPPTPSRLSSALTTFLEGTALTSLSPALQRALLWDAGYVRTNSQENTSYVDVYVLCGHTMSDVFLGLDSIDTTECSLEVCKQFSYNLAQSSCSAASIAAQTRCAVADDISITATTMPVWAQEGTIDGTFDAQMYQSSYLESATSTTNSTLYLISQVKEIGSKCASTPKFIVPCRKVAQTDVTLTNQEKKWCPPTISLGVTLWFQSEVAALSTSSSSRTTGGTITTTGNDSSGSSSSHTAAIVLGIALGLAVVACAVLLYLYCKSKQNASKQPPPPLGYASLGNGQHNGAQSTGTAGSGNQSSQHPSSNSTTIETVNDGFRQKSAILAEFCDDQDLMMKRIAYTGLHFGKLMASGANGEVWRGEYAGQQVAIKCSFPEKKNDIKTLEMFSQEIRLASALEHPNIVRFIGLSWRTLPELCMVSEFMGVGDLSHFLASSEGKQLTWGGEKVGIAADVANALVYLHSLMPVIIHRDLKSLNILLTEDLQAKLSDFGLSREQSFETTMTSGVGTMLWTAPEVLRGDQYTEKADIYSFGIVLSELDTCLSPYSLNDEVKGVKSKSTHLIPLISKGLISPKFSPECPEPILELAKACLDQDPMKRPPAMQIVYTLRSKIRPVL